MAATAVTAVTADAVTGSSLRLALVRLQQVTVIRLQMAPHQKTAMHEVTPRVVVWLTDAHLRLTFPDGSTRDLRQRAGDTGWLSRQRHAGENLGDAPIEFVAVVPKTR